MHGGHHREAAICVLHMISHAMLFTVSGSAQDTADKTKVAKNVWKVHDVGLGPNSHWVPTCSEEEWLVGAGMGPSREKTGARALGTSRGVSGGVLGLEGPLPLSD